jgi:hypothetical protein
MLKNKNIMFIQIYFHDLQFSKWKYKLLLKMEKQIKLS